MKSKKEFTREEGEERAFCVEVTAQMEAWRPVKAGSARTTKNTGEVHVLSTYCLPGSMLGTSLKTYHKLVKRGLSPSF